MLNNDDLIVLLTIGSCILGASSLFLATVWVRARERAIRAQAELKVLVESRGDVRRLEEAVDAISLEVERISEGQRFVSKLLAERHEQLLAAPELKAPRSITPH